LKPGSAETHNNLGKVYFGTKNYQEAALSFRNAVRLNGSYADAHHNLALTCVALGDKKCAFEEHKILKTLDPRLADEFFQRYLKK